MTAYVRGILLAGSISALVAVASGGCATGSKGSPESKGATSVPATNGAQNSTGEVMGPPEPYGPAPVATPATQEVYGPTPIQLRPVVLVLGPGMARGFAFAGALRALHEAKIPVGAILGTEMGGFMGALYGIDGNINHFEWALMKFREDAFQAEQKLLSRLFDRSGMNARFESGLQQAFGTIDLGASKIPLRVSVEQGESGAPAMLEKGEARAAVRATMRSSTQRSRPFLVSEAKALGIGAVVVINVMPELRGSKDLAEADLVIEPDMKGIGQNDFVKRTEAAYRGKQAVKDRLREIRHWVGLPEDGGESGGSEK